jgi:hypothetical protein
MKRVGENDVAEKVEPGTLLTSRAGFIWKSRVMLHMKPMVDEFAEPRARLD